MTLREYIENPMGKGSTILPNAKMKNDFNMAFRDISSSMNITWYSVMNSAIAIISLPSSSSSKKGNDYTYDIVFQFKNIESLNKEAIMESEFTGYSNSPSFIFTYAYVFYKNSMICRWLEGKLGRTIKSVSPAIRNKYNVISYERSLYLGALKVLQSMSGLTLSAGGFTEPIKSNYTQLASKIKSYDDVITHSKTKGNDILQKDGIRKNNSYINQHTKTNLVTPKTSTTSSSKIKKTATTSKTSKTKKI